MNGEEISNEKSEIILEAIRLAPTSMGLQPFKVLVIKDKEIRERMKQACYNQPQITESAFILVFAVWKDNYEQKATDYIELIAKTRNQSIESIDGFKKNLLNAIKSNDPISWAARQAYIAFGFGLATAAMLKIDTTPMEGFMPDELDKVLELDKLGLKSVVIMAIGNRDEKNDYLVNLPKVRKSKEDFFIHL
jgi:nitroreductase